MAGVTREDLNLPPPALKKRGEVGGRAASSAFSDKLGGSPIKRRLEDMESYRSSHFYILPS